VSGRRTILLVDDNPDDVALGIYWLLLNEGPLGHGGAM
jgi:hypothetical protein